MDKLKQRAKIAKTKARSTMSGVGGWLRRHLVFSIILAVVVLGFIGSLIFVSVYYRGKAAPGVTIANVNVGGQNSEQIVNTINGLVNNMQLSLTYGGKSATASASDLGVNIDADKIASEAVQTGQGNPFSIIFNRRHFDLTGSYDQAKVNAFVTENFPELSTVDDAAAQAAADRANQTLAQTIQITNNGQVLWTLDPWDIASWASFTANPDTHQYDIAYDQTKIKDLVNGTVTAQLTNKPVNQKAITDNNGTVLRVISGGKNGQVATNVDSIVSQVYDDLVDGRGGQIEMTTKEAPYGTDATIAADGRWIEYNISTYTVTLYERTNAVWSTNQTSNGKTSTPTITGLYSVWNKTYEQCMPNPPSPTPLCNIHYVTYWERSGYAFHEAWWMSYAAGNVRQGISHGCVNMFQADAKRVYDFASIGTPVWVHY